MELETIEKNGESSRNRTSKRNILLFGVFLFVFCGFTNKAMAWTGNGTANDPWLIGDGQTNTASAVKAILSGNTLTISGTGNMADFWSSTEGEAPWNYQYYSNSSSITNVVIQDGVTNIGDRAFHDLRNLQTITIPNSVTKIGRQSFYMEHFTNTNFQSITIPNSVMEIEGEAFKGCSSLKTVTIENGTTELNFSSFYYTGSEYSWGTKTDWFYGCPLQTLHFGRTLSSSSNNPFSGTSIQTLTIGNTVTSLGYSAFADCSVLADVTLEDGTTPLSFNYNSYQFSNCPIKTFYWGRNLVQYSSPVAGIKTLTSVTIGNNVNSIGSSDFNNCTSLASITIPSSITSIGDYAFYYCSSLKSITLTGSIASIGNSAFQYSGLTSVSIPNSVTAIYGSAFSDCTGLVDVTLVDGTTPLSFNYYSNQFYNCPIKTFYWGRNLVQYSSPCAGKATLTSVTIGNNVNSIGSSDFYNCTSLASISIPSSITSIGDYAFYYCSSLKSITLPGSIVSIGNSAFQYSGLTSVSIPNSVTSIYGGAFSDCTGLTDVTLEDGATTLSFNYSNQFSNCPIKAFYWGRNLVQYSSPVEGKTTLTTLTIGSNITSIGDYDFSGCSGLTQITSNPTMPPTIQSNTFNSVNKGIPIYIDCNYLAAYQSAPYWSDFTNYPCTLSLTVSPTTYNFPVSGGTSSAITITSNVPWTISSNALWLTTSRTSGSNNNTFTMTATANTATSSRSATITVSGSGITKTVNVTQEGVDIPENGVLINGIVWATRNVDRPGTFAAKPEDAGMFYQWNRKVGWSATDPLINSNGSTTWDSSMPAGSNWTEANDPCPDGWRVPKLLEIQESLEDAGEWTTVNGVNGRKFTDLNTGNSIFLPAAGTRNSIGELYDQNNGGYYRSNVWQSDNTYAAYFELYSYLDGWAYYNDSRDGMCIRCVAAKDSTAIQYIEKSEFNIYPNPVKDELFIESELPIKKVEIYSLAGALLLSDNDFNGKISVSALSKGIYMVRVYTDSGLVTEKVVKE